MIDLSERAGFNVSLNEKNLLVFGKDVNGNEADIRAIEQMKPVLQNPSISIPKECYYMYRGVNSLKDEKKISESKLRFDLTVIPPAFLGKEFNKTFGHFHPRNSAGEFFPELYEVINGNALFLLQSIDGKKFYAIPANRGEKIVVLPGFGHVTVNPSKTETLVLANWIEKTFKSDYSEFNSKKGAMHYFTLNGFEENKNYKTHAKPIELKPVLFPSLGLTKKPIYSECISNMKKFSWLFEPEKYKKEFGEYLNRLKN